VKSLFDLVLDGPKDFMKEMRACETSLKQPENKARLCPKPTPRGKKNKAREKHKKGNTYIEKIIWLTWET
jgi:hypothetical protein